MNDAQERFLDLLEGDQNDPDVQYALGRCYLSGTGVEQNGCEAEKWLRRAAEQGHPEAAALRTSTEAPEAWRRVLNEETLPQWCAAAERGDVEAQYQIAAHYLDHPDPAWVADVNRYLEMAAEQGHPQACCRLGRLLLPEQPQKAVSHLRNAADCGLPEAMEQLGECYAKGLGVPQNLEQAEQWFLAVARRGSGEDMLKLALRYKEGDGVPRSPGRALSWLKQARDAEVADAEARYYGAEWQTLKEQMERAALLRTRAEAGDPEAQNALGEAYAAGSGVLKDWTKAAVWYRKAAEQGHGDAQYSIAKCYRDGNGVEQNPEQYVAWLQKSAEQGNVKAQNNLGVAYAEGEGISQDWEQAAVWYRKAAEQGHAIAQRNLAIRYKNGEGVEKDLKQYLYWLRKAAEQGHAGAKKELSTVDAKGIPGN